MTLSRDSLRAVVLLGWSAFMAWLWISGETLRYLGPRTEWLVPFGAVTLGLAGAAAVWAARERTATEAPPLRELLGLASLVTPIAAALLLAHSQLGAQAASKKLTSRGIDPAALANLAPQTGGNPTFLDLSVAQKDREFAAKRGIAPGKQVRLVGFVSRQPKAHERSFELSRFYITCCVADSVPIGVTVLPVPGRRRLSVGRDDWLDVRGRLVRRGGQLRMQAEQVRRVPAPKHPYLSLNT